ncbi:MAG TPA: hypothetical protein VF327_08990 [Gaiellaceae bacterium]
MRRIARALGFFVVVCAAVDAVFALGGALAAYFHGGWSYAHAVGWALWIGGCFVVLLVGGSGSPSRMAGESRLVVGGRFVLGSDIPQPSSPFVLVPAGLLEIGAGVLIYLFA